MDKKVRLFIAGTMLLPMAVVIAILALWHKNLPPLVYIVVGIFVVLNLLTVAVIKGPAKRRNQFKTIEDSSGIL
jgi:hypothetical protein